MAAGPDWRDPSSGASPSSSLRFSLIERRQRLQRESMDERFEKMRAQAQRAREEELSRLDRRYETRMRDVRDGGAAVIARHRVTAQEVIAKAAAQQNLTRGGAPLPTDTALALSKEGYASVAQALGEYVIRILSSEWLLSQPNGFVLRRQSFLPTEAFLPPGEAQRLFESGQRRMGALSYAAAQRGGHPDPAGAHVAAVCAFLSSPQGHGVHGVFIEYVKQAARHVPPAMCRPHYKWPPARASERPSNENALPRTRVAHVDHAARTTPP